MINLQNLVEVLEVEEVKNNLNVDIKGISYDSRKIKDGYLFIAITGFKEDGHKFIDNAIKNGAVAIVVEREMDIEGVAVVRVKNARKAMAQISSEFYGNPSERLKVIGVTGTNGKTTTTYLIEFILNQLGNKTGLLGTIKNKIGIKEEEASRTTPESIDLQRMFAEMLDDGVTHVVMEVSSHALELERVLGVNFFRQVFTNLSQDHLDFHNSFTEYLAAKQKLFKMNDTPSIINFDDKYGEAIIEESLGEVLTYSIDRDGDFKANNIKVNQEGVSYRLTIGEESVDINLNLTGRFNVYNSLAAIATAYSMGFGLKDIKGAIEQVQGVAGRFQIIKEGQKFGVIVDYAHTPDGMENVLKTVNEFCRGRKIVVFGCGGDRDRKKRSIMGRIGVNLADFAIVTSDNPRSEEPMLIIADIEEGIKEENKVLGKDYKIIEDRGQAIKEAVEMAEDNDIVIIVGKGHETYQILKDKTIDFDDREIARDALKARGDL